MILAATRAVERLERARRRSAPIEHVPGDEWLASLALLPTSVVGPHSDSLENLVASIREVDWGNLKGAYGSSGSGQGRDVKQMLESLLSASDSEVDDLSWGMIYDDTFLSHVWHQYTIYPVTPFALGLLIRLVALRAASAPHVAAEVAVGVRLIAESAMNASHRQGDPSAAELGRACLGQLELHREFISSWVGGTLPDTASSIERLLHGLGAPSS